MEYVLPPVLILLVLRFAFPALIIWFFERFVEPRPKIARQQCSGVTVLSVEKSNAQEIEATRKDLDELKRRLDKADGS